jgi:hypothetical protein
LYGHNAWRPYGVNEGNFLLTKILVLSWSLAPKKREKPIFDELVKSPETGHCEEHCDEAIS